MSSLKDRLVIVTGESSGIGRAAASRFATLGAHVLITGRRAASLDDAAMDNFNIQSLSLMQANRWMHIV
jgi:NAD(P)-dependent dehydrogenase (short-subunit alcohol dehydrogenase family)